MGRFEQEFKNYEQYEDVDCYRKTVPNGMADALAERLATVCGADGDPTAVSAMRAVANDLLSMAGKKETTNWEAGALRTEIRSACHVLCEAKFDKFMDATLKAAERLYKECPAASKAEFLCDFNEMFTDSNFGYSMREATKAGKLAWTLRSQNPGGDGSLEAAAEAVKDISEEAVEHLQQARSHLLTPDRQRSRKDAVRDAMSAMEALLKKLSSEKDIAAATKTLRSQGVWGIDEIVKEGHSIWNHLHRLYPDIRHGQANATDIDFEEAVFWIDRMTAFIFYMVAKKRLLGR